jgi:hypothetical protein
MQLFGLHYYSIVDAHGLDWYSTMLDHYKLLNMNDFLLDVSRYVVN